MEGITLIDIFRSITGGKREMETKVYFKLKKKLELLIKNLQ